MKSQVFLALLSLSLVSVFSGCSNESESGDGKAKTKQKSGPKLTFHLPRELSAAAKRFHELHEQLVGNGELPSPLNIDYVEVIHGEGASAHSHYYLASKYKERVAAGKKDDHGDDHANMKEEIKERVYEVDFKTELADLAGWLPRVAARADLKEDDWKKVDGISKELISIVDEVSQKESDADFRKAWQQHADEIGEKLQQLNQLAAKTQKGQP